MKTLALDVDGVIADCAVPVHRAAERILQRELPAPEHWSHFDFDVSMGMTPGEAEFFHTQMLLDNHIGYCIDLYPGARDFVLELAKDFDVYFLTSPWRNMQCWHQARHDLIDAHFGDRFDLVFSSNKRRGSFDFLLDDKIENVKWLGKRGVLFRRPWNAERKTGQIVTSYADALEFFGARKDEEP